MYIKNIEVTNVKGLDSHSFKFDLHPNRPLIFVGPNGFGKSSFATAFSSLQSNKINLHEENYYLNDLSNDPEIKIEYMDDVNSSKTITADKNHSDISTVFDVFVINNQIKAKGTGRNLGKFTAVKASIIIEPITLIETVPQKNKFNFSLSMLRNDFGTNGKVLDNIDKVLNNRVFLEILNDRYPLLDQCLGKRNISEINAFIDLINQQTGTSESIKNWIDANLNSVPVNNHIFTLITFILNLDIFQQSTSICFLTLYQIIKIYELDKSCFKKAVRYRLYEIEKAYFTEIIQSFNSSWKKVKPKEQKGSLIVDLPKVNQVSNGQSGNGKQFYPSCGKKKYATLVKKLTLLFL